MMKGLGIAASLARDLEGLKPSYDLYLWQKHVIAKVTFIVIQI